VCSRESCSVSNDVLTSVAIRARGDIRAALNDLQMLSKMDVPELVKEVGERNREQTIFFAMQHVFKNAKIDSKMLAIFDEVNMPIDEIFLWMEHNIPFEYKGEELVKAFNALSMADVFRGRIMRQRHWRFLVYENFLLGAGIASVKEYNRAGFTKYQKPNRILKIWLQNQRNKKKKTICQKFARYTHISTKQAMKDWMMVRILIKPNEIRHKLKLSDEEVDYLDKVV
jgi:replication factor C large subunit